MQFTRIEVQDDLFPERSYRKAQQRPERAFQDRLGRLAGCKAAKDPEMPEQLRARYTDLPDRIELQP